MSEWVKLFTGTRSSARSLSQYLELRSVASRETAVPGPVSARPRRPKSRLRIEVRADDFENAVALYKEWEIPRAARAAARARRLAIVVALASIVPTLWVVSYFVEIPGTPYPEPIWVVGCWFAGAVGMSWIGESRARSEAIDRSS